MPVLDNSNNQVTLDDEEFAEHTLALAEKTIRFSALANSGGVLATISVIGATALEGKIINILALPLGFFSAGVACALLSTVALLMSTSEKVAGEHEAPWKFITKLLGFFSNSTDIGMVAFFVLGCISGVTLVALA